MKNALDYLTWEHVEVGVRITGCDKSFEGALEVPVLIDRRPVVEIGEKAFAKCEKITSVVIPGSVESVGMCAFEVEIERRLAQLEDGMRHRPRLSDSRGDEGRPPGG